MSLLEQAGYKLLHDIDLSIDGDVDTFLITDKWMHKVLHEFVMDKEGKGDITFTPSRNVYNEHLNADILRMIEAGYYRIHWFDDEIESKILAMLTFHIK